MLIKDLKQFFIDSISSLYDSNEAEAMFYLALKELEHKSRTDEMLNKEIINSDKFRLLVSELKTGKPIQYIIGHTYFDGLKFTVDKHVLIPRSETEELVEWVVKENKAFSGKLLDVGTGSGCIALSLKNRLPNAAIEGLDISESAVKVAKQNRQILSLYVSFYQLDILKEIPHTNYQIVVSNPPYISLNEANKMSSNVIDYEPHIALFAEDDVLKFYKRLAYLSKLWKCLVYAETSEFYIEELTQWFVQNLINFEYKSDLNGKTRFVKIIPNETK